MKRYFMEFNFKKHSWSSWEQKGYQGDTFLSLSFQKTALVVYKTFLDIDVK